MLLGPLSQFLIPLLPRQATVGQRTHGGQTKRRGNKDLLSHLSVSPGRYLLLRPFRLPDGTAPTLPTVPGVSAECGSDTARAASSSLAGGGYPGGFPPPPVVC